MKPTLTYNLKSLLLGSALAVTIAPTVQSANVPAETSSIETRVEKVRAAIENPSAEISVGNSDKTDADVMWWRNAWGNGGGWHNWHNGWRNGGWGNWHNF